MQTQMNRVDFDLIVNELLRSLDLGAAAYERFGTNKEFWGEHYFREFRTIGFTVPRQLGKTNYLLDWMDRDPKALLILRDDMVRRCLLGNWENQIWNPDAPVREATFADRVFTLKEAGKMLKDGTFPQYDTYLVDDSLFYFHFIATKFHAYLTEKGWYDVKIVHVG